MFAKERKIYEKRRQIRCRSERRNRPLLYIGATSSIERMHPVKMDGRMNFSENVNLSSDCTGDYITCQASIEDLSIKAINSRKISVKAIVTLKLICEKLQIGRAHV